MTNETLSSLVVALKEAMFSQKTCESWNLKAMLYIRCASAPEEEFVNLYKIDELFDLPPDDIVMIFRIGHYRKFEDVVISQSYITLLAMYFDPDPAVAAEVQRLKSLIPYPE